RRGGRRRPPRRTSRGARLVAREARRRARQRPGHGAAARGVPPPAGHDAAEGRRRVELLGVRVGGAAPEPGGRPAEPGEPVRGQQGRGGAPRRRGRAGRAADRPAPVLLRLRPPAAARHGVPPVRGGRAERAPAPGLRGRAAVEELHARPRRGGGDARGGGRGPAARDRRQRRPPRGGDRPRRDRDAHRGARRPGGDPAGDAGGRRRGADVGRHGSRPAAARLDGDDGPRRGARRPDRLAPRRPRGGAGRMRHRAAYVAFDRFPSSKGSAVHIAQMADELFARFGGGLLGVLGDAELPRYQREGTREIARFDARIPNLIDRAEAFSAWVAAHLEPHLGTLEVCHVRDPWSALPAVTARRRHRVVYEVNGLPSIELGHTWPRAAPRTLAKIRELERHCLERSDAVVVPSQVIGEAVAALGVPDGRISLVPNGADLPEPTARPGDAPARYIVYVGALQPWQGLDVLMRAFARLADLDDLRLVICASAPRRRAGPLRRLAERLGVAGRIDWRFTLPHRE